MTAWYMRIAMKVANSHRLLIGCIIGNIVVCGSLYALIEHHGPIAGMWWAVVTGSTVGYGDQYPTTTAGRFIGMVLIITSILFVAIATAQLSAKLIVNSDAWTDDEQEELKRKINAIYDYVVQQSPHPQCQTCGDASGRCGVVTEEEGSILRARWVCRAAA